jgi:hypothetical protein
MKTRVYKRRRRRHLSRRKLNAMMRGVRWHRRKKHLRLKEQMEQRRLEKRRLIEGASPGVSTDDPNDKPVSE